MDHARKAEWSVEEREKFEAIFEINLVGPKCLDALVKKRFAEKPIYEIGDQYRNFLLDKSQTVYGRYDAKLHSLHVEPVKSDIVGSLEKAKELGESSRSYKKMVDATGEKLEEKTTKGSTKGQPWTREEHELFLRGLEKYGRGKWRMICGEFLTTKTPAQVASHAQKYFNRPKIQINRRRSSIHDIRLENKTAVVNTTAASATPKSNCNYGHCNNATPTSIYSHLANDLALGTVFGRSIHNANICNEPIYITPFVPCSNFEDGIYAYK